MRVRRHIRSLAAGIVALVAAIASYAHMRDLALEHGQPHYLATLLPLSVDGMLVVASVVSAEDRDAGRPVRGWARVSFLAGVVGSVAANVLSAPEDITARVISAWPALALLLVVEMIATGQAVPAPAAVPVPPVVTESPKLPMEPAPELAREAVPATGVAPSVPAQRKPSRREARRQGREETMAAILQALTELPPGASLEAIGVKAGVSARTAGRYLEEAAKAGRLKAELLEPEPAPAAVAVPDDASTLLPLPDPDPTTGGRVPALSAT